MKFHSAAIVFPCLASMIVGQSDAATLYEYNFNGGSLANTGTAADGLLSPTGVTPVFVSSYSDSNGVTRNGLFDYSTGGGSASHHFSDIADQNLSSFTIGLWALNFDGLNPPSAFSSAFMNDDIQLQDNGGNWEIHSGNLGFGIVPTDVWQLIVLTNDGTNTRTYVDGALTQTFGDIGDQFNEIGIGTNRARDDNGRWNGLVDDVFVLDTTMTTTEVLDLYNAGIPEPSTLALFGLGGLLFAGRRKR